MNKSHFHVLVIFVLLIVNTRAQKYTLLPAWKTDTIIPIPESVLYHANVLYVSLMDGPSGEKDGKGGIALLRPDGNIIDLNWITGMNAPKGMAILKGKLYVADLNEIVIINIRQKKILQKITVDGAIVLNDVTADNNGVVYVSDPRAGRVFRLNNGTVENYLSGLTKPNGLKAIGNNLYVLANGSLYRFDKNKKQQLISQGMDENTDGLEMVQNGSCIVSCWNGIMYLVSKKGNAQVLIDQRKDEYYTADIGYNAKQSMIYVPSLFKKTVTAYKLKK
jgi:hypothetical protein